MAASAIASTVLITGASTGIGRAASLRFHHAGWNVVATMRHPDRDGSLADLANVLVDRLDVTDQETIDRSVAAAIERFGRIDALVNNAGFGVFGPLEASPMASIRRQFDTNVIGLLAVTKAVLPHFRRQRSGTIVNVSSIGGRTVFPLGSLYHGTKFAIEGLSEALTFECAAIGVRVRIVEPGAVATDFAGRSLEFNNDRTIPEYRHLVRQVAKHSPGADASIDPDSVAEVILRATEDDSDRLRYLVGEDAVEATELRHRHDDAEYLAWVRRRFHLDDAPPDPPGSGASP